MPRALAALGLKVRLGGSVVLAGVSIEVAPGEVVGVFGPSGAGKSTLFRAIAGEEPLDEGQVFIGDEDATSLPLHERARRGLGYVPQTPSVLWDLTVRENMRVFGRLAKGSANLDDGLELLRDLGLDARLGVRASALSGGERRKLELARALFVRPRVLVCDEPFAALDPAGKRRVGERLRALADDGASVLFADHDVREALRLCDRAALLLAGAIACDKPPRLFADDPLVRAHYVLIDEEAPPPSDACKSSTKLSF